MARPLTNIGGDLAQMGDSEYLQFPTQTINEGDTAPDPGHDGVVVYSDAEQGLVVWNALASEWRMVTPTSVVVEPGVDPIVVEGTVSIGNEVEVKNDSGNPLTIDGTGTGGKVPVEGTLSVDDSTPIKVDLAEISTTDTLKVDIQDASVEISNDSGNPVPVSGTVTANAGTGPWPVTDNGGSLTVDGTVGISGTVPVSDGGGSLTVDGTVGISGTVPVSDGGGSITVDAASWPLPTGAATAAKQPALGTAGTPSADVLTIQGRTGMTHVKVDGSDHTQPVSGTVSINDPIDVNVISGGGGGSSTVAQAHAAPLTLSEDEETPLAVTLAGDLKVEVQNELTIDDSTPIEVNVVAGGGSPDFTQFALVHDADDLTLVDDTTHQLVLDSEGFLKVNVSAGGGAVSFTDFAVVHDPDDLSLTDDTNHQLVLDSSGALKVNIVAGGSGGAVSITGEVEVKNDSGNPIPVSGTVSVTEPVSIDDNGGSISIDDGGNVITVDGTVGVSGTVTVGTHDVGSITTAVVPGTGATNLGKAEDAIHNSGDVGVMALAVRKDTPVAMAADGDYTPLLTDSTGRLVVTTGTISVNSHDIVNVTGTITPGTGATDLGKAEDAAHTSGHTGIFALGVRSDTPGATAAIGQSDLDYTGFQLDETGQLRTAPRHVITTGTITANAQTVVVNCAGASVVGYQQSGTFSSVSISFEATHDGTNWFSVYGFKDYTAAAPATSNTGFTSSTTAVWEFASLGWLQFRARCTGFSSGTMNVRLQAMASGAQSVNRLLGRSHSTVPTAVSSDDLVVPLWTDRSGAQVVIPAVRQATLTSTPTISTSAFSSGDQITAGSISISSANLATGRPIQIVNAVLLDKSVQNVLTELWIFPSTISTTNANSNDAFSIADATIASTMPAGIVDFLAADYRSASLNSICQGSMQGGPIYINVTPSSTNIGYILVTRGTPTYGSSTDLVLQLQVNQF